MQYKGKIIRRKMKNGVLIGPYMRVISSNADKVCAVPIFRSSVIERQMCKIVPLEMEFSKTNVAVIETYSFCLERKTFDAIRRREWIELIHEVCLRWTKLYNAYAHSNSEYTPLAKLRDNQGEYAWFKLEDFKPHEYKYTGDRRKYYLIKCKTI